MTRLETFFVPDGPLITVKALVTRRNKKLPGRFVLDTGAAMTTLAPELIEELGYSPRDRLRRTKVHSALGEERGYTVRVDAFSALRIKATNLEVNVFHLGYDDLDGLIGMNFLNLLYYDIRFLERRILAAPSVR